MPNGCLWAAVFLATAAMNLASATTCVKPHLALLALLLAAGCTTLAPQATAPDAQAWQLLPSSPPALCLLEVDDAIVLGGEFGFARIPAPI